MTPFVARATRVPTPPIETRLDAEYGRLVNVSATGALVRTIAPVSVSRECTLTLYLPDAAATLLVRIVRADATPVELPGATARLRQYNVAVTFRELSGPAKHAVATLCGDALTARE